jgi:hypothetical protein
VCFVWRLAADADEGGHRAAHGRHTDSTGWALRVPSLAAVLLSQYSINFFSPSTRTCLDQVGVEKLRDELAGVTTGLTLLESMVAAQ